MVDIEVVKDAYELAVRYGDGIPHNPRIHQIIDPPWLTSYRLAAKRPDLFAYIHEKTDNMVLAVWRFKPGCPHPIGIMTELEVCEPVVPRPKTGWMGGRWIPPSKDYMRRRCRPIEEQFADQIRCEEAAHHAEHQALLDNKKDRQEAARFLRNKNLDREAHDIETYRTPFERDESGDFADML